MSDAVSHLPGADSELMRLVNAACEGTSTLEDGRRLEALLTTASNRGFYLAATEVHASLLWRWQPGDGLLRIACPGGPQMLPADGPSPVSSAARAAIVAVLAVLRGWLRQLGRPAPLACLVSAALIGGLLLVGSRTHLVPETDGFGRAGTRVAAGGRVIGLHDVAWAAGQPPRQEWEALRPGDVLAITRGLVQLRHDGGAVVVLEGPATYTLLGPSSGRLDSGRVVARTEHGPRESDPSGPLFSIETRWKMVHDLGTEFGVEVGDQGEMGVHVFAGLVELATVDSSQPAPEPPLRLAAGASAGVDEAGRLVQRPGNLARGFVRAMPPQPGRRHTIFERIGWDETAAKTIYRDQFRATGSLASSTPRSRGGAGSEPWIAPPADWTMDAHGLVIDREGSGFLPFTPRPGRLYRLSIRGGDARRGSRLGRLRLHAGRRSRPGDAAERGLRPDAAAAGYGGQAQLRLFHGRYQRALAGGRSALRPGLRSLDHSRHPGAAVDRLVLFRRHPPLSACLRRPARRDRLRRDQRDRPGQGPPARGVARRMPARSPSPFQPRRRLARPVTTRPMLPPNF